MAQSAVAAMLGMKPEQVSVRTTVLVGSFGRRVEIDFVRLRRLPLSLARLLRPRTS
ncbi:MAG: hypothetical protein WBD34_24145 [Burkholderiaceae bacterium]